MALNYWSWDILKILYVIPPPFKNSENSVMTQALIYLSPSAGTVARYQGSIQRLEVMLEMQAGQLTIKLKLSRWSRNILPW